MSEVQKYENEQALKALKGVTDFLNTSGTRVELAEKTILGEKYVAVNGQNKKEIQITKTDTLIVNFVAGNFVGRDVVFYDGVVVKSAVEAMKNGLKRLASEKNLATKVEYALDKAKTKIQKEFQGTQRS